MRENGMPGQQARCGQPGRECRSDRRGSVRAAAQVSGSARGRGPL